MLIRYYSCAATKAIRSVSNTESAKVLTEN